MNLKISVSGIGGHTQLNFEGNTLAVEWKETTEAERKSLGKLIADAKARGYKPVGDEATSFEGAGTAKLEGGNGLKFIAETFVNAHFVGHLVMEAQPNGESKILSASNLVIKENEPQAIHVAPAVVGG